MPGEDMNDALRAAGIFSEHGIGQIFTRLGENLSEVREADLVTTHYLNLMGRIEEQGLQGELSVKLTQLGLDLDPALAEMNADSLAARASATGRCLWLDMEGSLYTETTIALYERLRTRGLNVGICLQAYLRRTEADVRRLLPLRPSIRLVKGAYAEPATLAYVDRNEVDRNYVAIGIALLDAVAQGQLRRLALGTHDVALIRELAGQAEKRGLDRHAFEVQMLYGIRVDQQRRLVEEGFPVRDLIAYGPAWYAWYMRRLAERPANLAFALRQLL